MEILTKSVHVIEYENGKLFSRDIPETFDEYVTELVGNTVNNDAVRNYKTTSNRTEVIGCVKEIIESISDENIVKKMENNIAKRLLKYETEAQLMLARMNKNIQKGSLIQALLYDEEAEEYSYLLAKVEHSKFFDDVDFSIKTGFSREKKSIWKTCIIALPDLSADIFYAKIYSDSAVKYWYDGFLELEELHSDENNTQRAFKSVDYLLKRSYVKKAPYDSMIIRNAMISWFKREGHFDYNEMVNTVLSDDYIPTDMTPNDIIELRKKLLELPTNKDFDRQFNTVPTAITAKIKKVYDVTAGIQIKITDEIDDIENTITAYRDEVGNRFIKIKTNNDETFRSFYKD